MTIEACNLIIANHVTERQAELDATAAIARTKHIQSLRAALVKGLTGDLLTIGQTVAAGVAVGRESDGFPVVVFADDVKAMLQRATVAGMLPLNNWGSPMLGAITFHSDFSGLATEAPGYLADNNAWRAAKEYREKTTTP